MDDTTLIEMLGVPWDQLKQRHQEMARGLLNDPSVGNLEKAAQFAVHLMASQGGYEGAVLRALRKRNSQMLRALAEGGDRESQGELGQALLYGGVGIAKKPAEAVDWLTRALEQGDARAAFDLGCLFEYHRGAVRRDIERSQEYFRLAEAMGFDSSRG